LPPFPFSDYLDANGIDLEQMDLWYRQAGTPIVKIEQEYLSDQKLFRIKASQRTPTTPGPNQLEEDKRPVIIPLVTGLLDSQNGKEIVPSQLLVLKEASQTFEFPNIQSKPVLSTLRDFSAPVNLEIEQSDEELLTLMAYDTDAFNSWDAGNRYFTKYVLQLSKLSVEEIKSSKLPDQFISALKTVLLSAKV
jgi:aminopeptidase N